MGVSGMDEITNLYHFDIRLRKRLPGGTNPPNGDGVASANVYGRCESCNILKTVRA